MTVSEARFLRRGDVVLHDGRRRLIKRTTTRKSDNTVRVVWLADDSEIRMLGEDLVDILERDRLTFPAGPGTTRYGR
jgi:hypothetical protein